MGNWKADQFKKYDPTKEGYGSARQWRKAFSERMGYDEAQKIMSSQAEGPYAILGIHEGSTKAEIKKAYFTLVKEWHPDRNPDRVELATEMMKKINAAYTILTDR